MPQPHKGRIDRHRNSWRIQIKVGGQRIRKAFPTRAEAEAALAAILEELNRDAAAELAKKVGPLTVNDVVEFYRERRWKHLEQSTIRRYDGMLAKHVTPKIGLFSAKDVIATPILIEEWLDEIPWGQGRKALEVLNPAFKLARDNGLVASNPIDRIRRPKRPDRKRKKQIPTPSEVEKIIIGAYELGGVWWGYYVELVAVLGLRRSEACALRWEDFTFPKPDEPHGKVLIRRAVGMRKGGLYIKPPKGRIERELLVHRSLFEGLWELDGETGWVFPGRDVPIRQPGQPLSRSSTGGRLILWLDDQDGEATCPSGRVGANARRAIGTNSATFSDVSKKLEAEGLIERDTNARRTFRIALTEAGLTEAERLWNEDVAQMPIGPTTMGHRFSELLDVLDIKAPNGDAFSLHSLRHFRATHLYNASRDWVQVAKYLGHASPSITMELYANNVVQPTQAMLADSAIRFI